MGIRRVALVVLLGLVTSTGAFAQSAAPPEQPATEETSASASVDSSAATAPKARSKSCEELETTAIDKASNKLLSRLEKIENGKGSDGKKVNARLAAVIKFSKKRVKATSAFLDCVSSVTLVDPATGVGSDQATANGGADQDVATCSATFASARSTAYSSFSSDLAAGRGKPVDVVVAGASNAIVALDAAIDQAVIDLALCIDPVPLPAATTDRSAAIRTRGPKAGGATFAECGQGAVDGMTSALNSELARFQALFASGAADGPRALAVGYATVQADTQLVEVTKQLATCLKPLATQETSAAADAHRPTQNEPGPGFPPICPPTNTPSVDPCVPPPPKPNPTVDECIATYQIALAETAFLLAKNIAKIANPGPDDAVFSADDKALQIWALYLLAISTAHNHFVKLIACAAVAPDA